MSQHDPLETKISRRRLIQAAAATALTGPYIISARGEQPVKMGYDDPLTGTYAAVGKNELIGCQLAVEQINKKGGILGRPVELVVEDRPAAMPAPRCRRRAS
jgi:branched-chain amino acid transport system substrate-binding protein